MRLSWPFRRTPSSTEVLPDGASARSVAAAPPGARPAWRELPPLAETIGPPPLVAPSRPFAAALTSTDPPAPILAPLAHGRSLEAPRGIVVGVARPPTSLPGTALPKPVQRAPVAGMSRSSSPTDDSVGHSFEASDAAPAPVPTIGAVTASSPGSPAEVISPLRRLPLVSPASSEPRAAIPSLTRAPHDAAPAPQIGRVGQPTVPGTLVRQAPRPLEAAIQRAPAETQRPTPVQPASETGTDVPRLSLGQARRRGLGAPILGGQIPRVVAASAVPTPHPAMPIAQSARPAAAGAVTGGPAGEPGVTSFAPAIDLAAGAQTGLRAAETPIGASTTTNRPLGTVVARPLGTASLPAASGPGARNSGAPLISARPLRTGVQRAPLTVPRQAATQPAERGASGGPPDRSPGGFDIPGGVRVHRGTSAAQMASSLNARAFTQGSDVYLPASHGPLSSGPARSLLAHELTHVAQQRRLGSALPVETSPSGHALEAEAVAAERRASLPLAHASSGGSERAGAGAAEPHAPAQRAAAFAGAPPATEEPATVVAGSAAQRAPANPTTDVKGDAAGPRRSEQELEDLAHELYGRIGRRLRRELLVDRERSGFVMDLP